ncbi:lytic transglycosylase domain-containing protein [Yoonia sp. 208BN28-4]|uniref:lytic transglycosylase domain-containing protein n=1 Tax=Yoonia sp. 208BN28-4 TaxID=3126505 RepID=UPI0030AF43F8
MTSIAVAIAVLMAPVAVPSPARAEMNRLQPDFTFRRVTVPSGSANRRITVQVEPRAPSAPQAPAAAGAAAAIAASASPSVPRASGYEWFWAGVSPALSDSGPGRLQQALRTIDSAPDGKAVATPRLQHLQQIANSHGLDILRATVGTDVSPALVLALIAIESAGQEQAESHAGAVGLMQLMPATAARFGVTDRTNPADNIKGGVAYLSWLMNHFDNDPVLVLAGYNAGEGSVRDNAGVPPYAETRAYVPKVLAAWSVARGLCITPPELVTDGCVFHNNGT